MKILLVTQWFDPEPTFKGLLFARALKDSGHEVEVLTGFPNYPGGKIYKGYKISLYKKEVLDGVVVHRVPLYPSHNSSSIKRVINYASFAVSSFVFGLLKVRRVDVIYSYHPPLTTNLSAIFLGIFKRIPVVVDVQDLWPDTLAATGMLRNQKVLSAVGSVCRFVYRRSSKIVVLSPGFKDKLISREVPEEKIKIIYNWCDEYAISNFIRSEVQLPLNDNLNVLFAGNLGFAQGLPVIVRAAGILKRNNIPVNVVFLGDGVAKSSAIDLVDEMQLDNVFFLPRVPMNEVGSLLSSADILLVHLNDDELFTITIPSRTQANLAIGRPIVMGVSGDAAKLVMDSGSGIVCKPNCAESLAISITDMANKTVDEREKMGLAGRDFYYKNLSLQQGVQRFINVFESVVGRNG